MKRRDRKNALQIIADNLRFLMNKEGLSERSLERKCGVGHKTINNILNARHAAKTDNLDTIASHFGLELWQLMLPDLQKEIENVPIYGKLQHLYTEANSEGRKHILMVAEREAEYAHSQQQSANPASAAQMP